MSGTNNLSNKPDAPPHKTTGVAGTPVISLVNVVVKLKLVDELVAGGTAIAKSALSKEGGRRIRISLNKSHLLVSKSLLRADALTVRFLVALSLTEFTWAWGRSHDGKATERALKQLAGLEVENKVFGSGFASALAGSESLRVVDGLPVFGRNGADGPFELFSFTAPLASPSGIAGWREGEPGEPLPPKPPKPIMQEPVAVAPPTAAADPFLLAFHQQARELLDAGTFEALTDLAKGAVNV